MNLKLVTIVGVGIAACCCAFTHRRVIKAVINHEEMPKAPQLALLG